jgi:hypothetical protein
MGISFADAKMESYSYSPKVQLVGTVLTVDAAPCRIGSEKFDMDSAVIDLKEDAGKQFTLNVIRREGSSPTFYLVVSDMQARPQTPEQEAGAQCSYILLSGTVSQDGKTVDGRVLRFGW